jgi:hypothetical protein
MKDTGIKRNDHPGLFQLSPGNLPRPRNGCIESAVVGIALRFKMIKKKGGITKK